MLRRVPNSSAPPVAEAEQPHTSPSPSKQSHGHENHPNPLPRCLPLPSNFLKCIHPVFETSEFHILPFPSSSSSLTCLLQARAPTPCPHTNPGAAEADGTAATDPHRSGNPLSGHRDSSVRGWLVTATRQEKRQKSPGAPPSLPSQPDSRADPPRPSSFLTAYTPPEPSTRGDFKAR